LVTAAIRLFAERGFEGTTVGDIEDAAGLTRRGGGFYRHFDSKDAVLGVAIEAHVGAAEQSRAALALLPFGDLRSELSLVCRWLLDTIDQQRDLLTVIERDGGRFPKLRDAVGDQLVDSAHRAAVEFTGRWATVTGHPSPDPAASAVIMIGAALSYKRLQWAFAKAPLDVDDDRFVATWVRYCYELMTGTPMPDAPRV